jgi:hypothetical protein
MSAACKSASLFGYTRRTAQGELVLKSEREVQPKRVLKF